MDTRSLRWRYLGAFLIGLGLVGLGLRWVADREAPMADRKLAYLEEQAADCDVVVLGSSVIAVGFRAAQFDERMKKHGHTTHAFGFGTGGLFGAELDYYVHRILALRLPKLRWLLIDVTLDQDPRMAEANWYTQREIAWQTPRQHAIVAGEILQQPEPLFDRVEVLWPYTRHLMLNVFNIGRGVAVSRALAQGEASPRAKEQARAQKRLHKETQAARYKQRAQAHHKKVARLRARDDAPPSRDNALAAAWRDVAEAQGVKVAFVVGPAMNDARFPARVPGSPSLTVFDFNDPVRYPTLYDIDYHYDRLHLTEVGARSFSRHLADALAGELEDEAVR